MADLLPRTLASLAAGGFDSPSLFIDGTNQEQEQAYRRHWPHLEMTFRCGKNRRAVGNWAMGMTDLLVRNPTAERFAMFQDDVVCVRNLRQYLETKEYPDGPENRKAVPGYWNLYTAPSNTEAIRGGTGPRGWYPSNQYGRGALGLVFSRTALVALLGSPNIVQKPLDVLKGWRSLDGAVVQGMKNLGWIEYVHSPSLVQHLGRESVIDKRPHAVPTEEFPTFTWSDRWQAPTFPGEDFDALTIPAHGEVVPDEWQREREALERAIADDKIRLGMASEHTERRRLRRLIAEYETRLKIHMAQAR